MPKNFWNTSNSVEALMYIQLPSGDTRPFNISDFGATSSGSVAIEGIASENTLAFVALEVAKDLTLKTLLKETVFSSAIQTVNVKLEAIQSQLSQIRILTSQVVGKHEMPLFPSHEVPNSAGVVQNLLAITPGQATGASIQTNRPLRYSFGVNPSQTQGFVLLAGESFFLKSAAEVQGFRFINSETDAKLSVIFYADSIPTGDENNWVKLEW